MDLNNIEQLVASGCNDFAGETVGEMAALIRRQEAELAEARATIQRMTASAYDDAEKVDRLEEALASLPVAGAVLDEAALRESVAEGISSLYGCGRVWNAWNVGTMTQDDFYGAGECDECIDQVMDAIRPYLAAQPAAAAPDAQAEPRPSDDALWDATIRDRDQYHEWADKLADAISKYFGAYIGEHSNTNLPWAEALEAIEAAEPFAAAQPEAKAAPAQAPLQANAGPSHGDMPVDRLIKAMPLPRYPSAAAPAMGEEVLPGHLRAELSDDEATALAAMVEAESNAMGEELPPIPAHPSEERYRHFWSAAEEDAIRDYGRACMALRQQGADLLAKMVAAPVAVSSKAEDGSVPVPTNANMAKMMVLLGSNWLATNAPDQIATAPVSQPAAPKSFAEWCSKKGLEPEKCDRANMWIREAFEAGRQPAAQEPFGMYVERDDGTTEFQRTGKAFQPTASAYRAWMLFTAPQPLCAPAGSEQEGAAFENWFAAEYGKPDVMPKGEFKSMQIAFSAGMAEKRKGGA